MWAKVEAYWHVGHALRGHSRDQPRAEYGQHTEQPWAVPPDEDPQQGRPLRARFGELYTYKMVDGGDLSSPDPFVVCAVRARGDRPG